MQAPLELALLTRVIDDNDFVTLERARIDESYFTNAAALEVYKECRDTYHNPLTAGRIPSRELLQQKYPAMYFAPSSDSAPILAKLLREQRIKMDIQDLAQRLADTSMHSPLEALATLRSRTAEIAALSETAQDFTMAGAVNMLRARYDTVSTAGGIIGIPFPWHALNEATQGMQNGQFLVFYGRPKSMKTWIALYIGIHAYLAARRRVLIYSREMPPEILLQRAASIIARVDYERFKAGKLQPAERDRVFAILSQLAEDERYAGSQGQHQPCFVVCSDRGSSGGGGVSWLKSKIKDLQPDLVIVDGMYLMSDDRTKSRTIDWKNITHISQDMKLTCSEYNIPIIGVTQANRGAEKGTGEDLTELAFADAIGQDADGVFRVTRTRPIDPATKSKVTELIITAPGLREGIFEGIVIKGNPGYDFSYLRTLIGPSEGQEAQSLSSGPRAPPRVRPPSRFDKSGMMIEPALPKYT